jgi:SAM-dependent methyltransferase
VKTTLKRVPGLVTTYRHVQLLSTIAYERWWADPQRLNDRAILNGEWHFESPAEQARYQLVLTAATASRGDAPWGDVLEIGCAEGLFTREIIRRAASVTAYDISRIACERTVRAFPSIRVQRVDIEREPVPGTFDLIFLMCVLGCLHGRRTLRYVSTNLANALRPGGLLVFNELRFHNPAMDDCWWARALVEGGQQLSRFLDGRHGLSLIHHEMHVGHVIGIYEKQPPVRPPVRGGKS